jgi:hypothetical protein
MYRRALYFVSISYIINIYTSFIATRKFAFTLEFLGMLGADATTQYTFGLLLPFALLLPQNFSESTLCLL